jgi:hypothetical protein
MIIARWFCDRCGPQVTQLVVPGGRACVACRRALRPGPPEPAEEPTWRYLPAVYGSPGSPHEE